MQIAHVIQYIGKNFGGPVAGMAGIASGLARLGHEVEIYSTHRPGDGEIIHLPAEIKTYICHDVSLGSLRYSPLLWRSLAKTPCSLIHSHGLWGDPNRCAAVVARGKVIPHLLAPCGMLEPNALRRSSWKKYLVKRWFQECALREAACLQAKSEKEYQDIRAYGLTTPVAVIPNPIPGPEALDKDPAAAPDGGGRFAAAGKKTVVFLGRIHPVKGVLRLAEAWCRVAGFHDTWELIIAGPDEGGFQAIVEESLRQAGCAQTVRFTGALDSQKKWAVLQTADLFVMPSDFENFGNAIVEAMMAGLPVITTTRTPWEVLARRNAGWWVEPTAASLEHALRQAMALSAEERQLRGDRGRLLAAGYSPEKVAEMLVALYNWLLHNADRPSFVQTN